MKTASSRERKERGGSGKGNFTTVEGKPHRARRRFLSQQSLVNVPMLNLAKAEDLGAACVVVGGEENSGGRAKQKKRKGTSSSALKKRDA